MLSVVMNGCFRRGQNSMLRLFTKRHQIDAAQRQAPVKTKRKVFRSALCINDLPSLQPPQHSLLDTAQKALADVVILKDSDPNLKNHLAVSSPTQSKIPIYIRTKNPELIGNILQEYHDRVEGLVADEIETTSSMNRFVSKLTSLENDGGLSADHFALIPVLDTTNPYSEWAAIAASSARNVAVILEDNAAENNDLFPKPPPRVEVHAEAVLAARAAEIEVILGPDMNISHYSFYRKRNEQVKDNGFSGQVTLNFDQSVIAHDVFSVSHTEKVMMNGIFSASKSGIGTWRRSDQESRLMAGPPHRAWAAKLQEKLRREEAVDGQLTKGRKIKLHPELLPEIVLGKMVESPLRIHLDVLRGVWQRSYPEISPLQMSDEYAKMLGFDERALPFSMLTSMAIALSVMKFTSPVARFHLGIYNAIQYRPVRAEDELTGSYMITDIRHSKDGYPIVKSRHFLTNEKDETVVSIDKTTMMQRDKVNLNDGKVESSFTEPIPLLEHIMQLDYSAIRPKNQTELHPGQIIRHKKFKCYNQSEARGLSNIIRATNAHHVNHRRYLDEDLVVFGMGAYNAAIAASSSELGHVIHETWPSAINVNVVNQTDVIRALTYVRDVRDMPSNDGLEEVELKTFSIKNINVETFQSVNIPQALLVDDSLKPGEIEKQRSEKKPKPLVIRNQVAHHFLVHFLRG